MRVLVESGFGKPPDTEAVRPHSKTSTKNEKPLAVEVLRRLAALLYEPTRRKSLKADNRAAHGVSQQKDSLVEEMAAYEADIHKFKSLMRQTRARGRQQGPGLGNIRALLEKIAIGYKNHSFWIPNDTK
jgi:hypothetical protein